jgi:hypothetical protein
MSEGLDNALPGFRFESTRGNETRFPLKDSEPKPIELEVTEQQKSFKIAPDGTVELHGYSGEEVIKILTAYRKHMTELMKQAQAVQGDNPLYHPGGYQ